MTDEETQSHNDSTANNASREETGFQRMIRKPAVWILLALLLVAIIAAGVAVGLGASNADGDGSSDGKLDNNDDENNKTTMAPGICSVDEDCASSNVTFCNADTLQCETFENLVFGDEITLCGNNNNDLECNFGALVNDPPVVEIMTTDAADDPSSNNTDIAYKATFAIQNEPLEIDYMVKIEMKSSPMVQYNVTFRNSNTNVPYLQAIFDPVSLDNVVVDNGNRLLVSSLLLLDDDKQEDSSSRHLEMVPEETCCKDLPVYDACTKLLSEICNRIISPGKVLKVCKLVPSSYPDRLCDYVEGKVDDLVCGNPLADVLMEGSCREISGGCIPDDFFCCQEGVERCPMGAKECYDPTKEKCCDDGYPVANDKCCEERPVSCPEPDSSRTCNELYIEPTLHYEDGCYPENYNCCDAGGAVPSDECCTRCNEQVQCGDSFDKCINPDIFVCCPDNVVKYKEDATVCGWGKKACYDPEQEECCPDGSAVPKIVSGEVKAENCCPDRPKHCPGGVDNSGRTHEARCYPEGYRCCDAGWGVAPGFCCSLGNEEMRCGGSCHDGIEYECCADGKTVVKKINGEIQSENCCPDRPKYCPSGYGLDPAANGECAYRNFPSSGRYKAGCFPEDYVCCGYGGADPTCCEDCNEATECDGTCHQGNWRCCENGEVTPMRERGVNPTASFCCSYENFCPEATDYIHFCTEDPC